MNRRHLNLCEKSDEILVGIAKKYYDNSLSTTARIALIALEDVVKRLGAPHLSGDGTLTFEKLKKK